MNRGDLTTYDLETGYFAHPEDAEAEFPPVHAVVMSDRDWQKPLCGAEIPEGHEYQWCSGILWMPYVDCKGCQREVHEMGIRQGAIREDRLPRKKAEKLFRSWGPVG
jgi:hypothetical protein